MFKSIQQRLLLRYPLLWNTKIVPLGALLLALNLCFFILGFAINGISFEDTHRNFFDFDATLVLLSLVISLLILILWLVNYFKNNLLKSFYPTTKYHVFKEWGLIFLLCFGLTSPIFWYNLGKETRYRSYFSREELEKRCATLRAGSFFLDGSYTYHESDEAVVVEEALVADTVVVDSVETNIEAQNYFMYRGKKYKKTSLLNKNVNSYTIFDEKSDSLAIEKLKIWLVTQQKDSLKKLFTDYLKIVKEHQLEANINADEWLTLINDYPLFEKSHTIGPRLTNDEYYPNMYNNQTVVRDTIDRYIARDRTGTEQEFYKYYVPEKNLNFNYDRMADAHEDPDINLETLIIPVYFALGLSLLILSFRVTSGRSWLIGLIAVIILNIVLGICSVIISSSYTYGIGYCIVFIIVSILFFNTVGQNRTKGYSGVVLNLFLWLLPGVIPIFYLLIHSYLTMQYNSINSVNLHNLKHYKYAQWMENHVFEINWMNIFLLSLVLFFIGKKIRLWRGIAEA